METRTDRRHPRILSPASSICESSGYSRARLLVLSASVHDEANQAVWNEQFYQVKHMLYSDIDAVWSEYGSDHEPKRADEQEGENVGTRCPPSDRRAGPSGSAGTRLGPRGSFRSSTTSYHAPSDYNSRASSLSLSQRGDGVGRRSPRATKFESRTSHENHTASNDTTRFDAQV